MSRLIDRLGQINFSNPQAVKRSWQKLAEQVEEQLIDINAALANMPDIAPITITADYTGVVDSGQLPRTVRAYRYQLNTDVTTDATWSFTVESGSITASIGASTGILQITALGSSSVVSITSDYGGVTKTRLLTVTKQLGGVPTSGGGGGTSATDTSFASFNSASMATVSDELTVTVGSGGNVTLSAPLTVYTDNAAPAATYKVYGIWQWDSTGGGVWVDLGTETASSPDCYVEYDLPNYNSVDGAISVSYSHTGLAASSSQKYRLRARNSSGTRTMYLSGTASAVGS